MRQSTTHVSVHYFIFMQHEEFDEHCYFRLLLKWRHTVASSAVVRTRSKHIEAIVSIQRISNNVHHSINSNHLLSESSSLERPIRLVHQSLVYYHISSSNEGDTLIHQNLIQLLFATSKYHPYLTSIAWYFARENSNQVCHQFIIIVPT